MLPPFIIEQIRRREQAEKIRQEQPRLELPLDSYRPLPSERPDAVEVPSRGVVVVDV